MIRRGYNWRPLATAGTGLLLSGLILAQGPLEYAEKMAGSIMTRRPDGYGQWTYVTGTVLKGFEELWKETGEKPYFDYIQKTVDAVIGEDGTIKGYNRQDYNIDMVREGGQLLFLYRETGEEKYRKAAALLHLQMEEQPRTRSGGFWHKERYPWQMWLDGLYMGSPFLAEYGLMFGEPADLDEAVLQIIQMDLHAYDAATGLYFHGWDESREQEWADPETGCSPSFWSRAIGWYAMAIADVLDYLPADHPGRASVIAIFNRVADGIARFQDPESGVWWQVTDQFARDSNYLESSASCMFVYALAKGVRLGYLEDEPYSAVALKGYRGILDHFIEPGPGGTIDLTQVCRTAGLGYGRDGTYNYYTLETEVVSNDGKGTGPFVLAGIEIARMDSP